MEYKTRYRPIEALGPDGWMRLGDDDEPTAVMAPREQVEA